MCSQSSSVIDDILHEADFTSITETPVIATPSTPTQSSHFKLREGLLGPA
jgi:hypothetical protein